MSEEDVKSAETGIGSMDFNDAPELGKNPWKSEASKDEEADVPPKEEDVPKSRPFSLNHASIASGLSQTKHEKTHKLIFGMCVVDFHHVRGPEIEYWLDDTTTEENERAKLAKFTKIWPQLPFQALPDGAHLFDETFTNFTLTYDEAAGICPGLPIEGDSKAGENITTDLTTLFGCACIRQLDMDELKKQGRHLQQKQGEKEFKRSVIQKSVVLITKYPITIQLKEKLGIITKSYFEQLDFSDKSIIKALYDNASLLYNQHGFEIQDDELYDETETSSRTSRDGDTKIIRESDFYSGFNLKDLVTHLERKLLVIYKSLLLEKRVLVFCKDLNVLSNIQYSLLSLIPNLVLNLSDSGTPTLDNLSKGLKTPTSLKSSDRGSMLRFIGMPLQLFSKGGFFQPYLTLQQLDYLSNPSTKSFLVGSSNEIILQNKKEWFDVILYIRTPASESSTGIETSTDPTAENAGNTASNATSFFFKEPQVKLEIFSKNLKDAVALTWQDKRFIDYVVNEVNSDNKRMLERSEREGKDSKADTESLKSTFSGKKRTSNSRSKTLNNNLSLDSENYSGGDDFIRYQFEDYLIGMLSTIKYDNFLMANKDKQETLTRLNLNQFEDELTHFNVRFITEYKKTVNYNIFARYTEDELFNFFDPVHVGTVLYNNQETEGAGALFKSILGRWNGGVEEKKKAPETLKAEDSASKEKDVVEETKTEVKRFSANVNDFWKRVQQQMKGTEKKEKGDEEKEKGDEEKNVGESEDIETTERKEEPMEEKINEDS